MKTVVKCIFMGSIIWVLFPAFGKAQNTVPVVEHVTFSQRTDGSYYVDIRYDLADADGDTMTVFMQVSDDSGSTWNFPCQNISGDVGAGIQSGTNKHILWDFGTEHPNTFGNAFQIKVLADDSGHERGSVTDQDGNMYQTVKIGDQWWMAENLKVTHYRNGDAIPKVTSNSEWTDLSSGAYCAYDNDESHAETYGYLYNWYAVDDSRNIAPEGWRVPTDEDWKELEMALGMSQAEADGTGYRGSNEGSKLAGNAALWDDGDLTNNSAFGASGFSALPGGYRIYFSGIYTSIGVSARFWSSLENYSGGAWHRTLNCHDSDIAHACSQQRHGYAVRCVRD